MRALLVVATMLIVVGPARAETVDDVTARIRGAEEALDAWQLEDAVEIASTLERALPDEPAVQALVGLVKFHQGDYEGALRFMERAGPGEVDGRMFELARSTADETRGAVVKESAHFVVRTPPGKDELLADIALEHLEEALAAVGQAFDYTPDHKIVVDVLHDPKGLARVSTLTEVEIETSGTIALCKFNRIMITSPKALARGYSWIDTLAHELIHLVISEKSRNTVPIWLHEGLAKYSESLWRGKPGLALEPASENLLAKATKSGKLITFEQMHPSMAKLPSQEDTALAFAEVFTVIEFMHTLGEKKGRAGAAGRTGFAVTNALLDALKDGQSMDRALRKATGLDLKGLQGAWQKYLKKRPFRLTPGAEPEVLTFVKNARAGTRTVDDDEDQVALAEAARSKESRRFVKLGGMLRRRGHVRAAVVEYEKARGALDVASPALNNRLAQLQIELGLLDEAKGVLDATVRVFPDDPQTRVLLGRLAFKQGRHDEAREHYRRATWENPFNPEIWIARYQIAELAKRTDDKARAERAIALLSQHARAHGRAKEQVDDDTPTGTLTVTSDPWGEVIIDGEPTGITTPLLDYRLAPGEHTVRVKAPLTGDQGWSRVTIVDGGEARLPIKLRAVTPDELEAWMAKEQALGAPTLQAPPTPPDTIPSDDDATAAPE